MHFQLAQAVEILERTPGVLAAMLSGLSNPWVQNNYGPDTFSPFDVVGHLIHGERTDWLARAKTIIEHGESRPFEPFDRYAMFEASRGKDLPELLETFASLRRDNLAALRAMPIDRETLQRTGTHPAFGPVTLEQLLATWAVHDLNHLAQISRSLAFQYRKAVGPWREYLSILPADS